MKGPAKNLYLIPIEYLWWKFLKMVNEEAPSIKDLGITIWKSWSHFDKEYCFHIWKNQGCH